jgi:hypothetical protein
MVKGATWYRDSHGLFDFEARLYTDSEFYFRNSGFIGITDTDNLKFMRNKSDQIDNGSQDSIDKPYRSLKGLLSVVKYKNKYFVFTRDRYTSTKKDKIWHVMTNQYKKQVLYPI